VGAARDDAPLDRVGTARDEEPLDLDGTARDTPLERDGGLTRVGAVLRGTALEDPDERVGGTIRVSDEDRVDGTARVFEDRVAMPERETALERVAVFDRDEDAGGFDVDVRGTACPRIVDERSDGRVDVPLLVRASGTTRVSSFDEPMPRRTAGRSGDGGVACVPDRTAAPRSGRRVSTFRCGVLETTGARDGCTCWRMRWSSRDVPRTGSSEIDRVRDGGVLVTTGRVCPIRDGCAVPVPRPVSDPLGSAKRVGPVPRAMPGPDGPRYPSPLAQAMPVATPLSPRVQYASPKLTPVARPGLYGRPHAGPQSQQPAYRMPTCEP
jgi:hypothetical protein